MRYFASSAERGSRREGCTQRTARGERLACPDRLGPGVLSLISLICTGHPWHGGDRGLLSINTFAEESSDVDRAEDEIPWEDTSCWCWLCSGPRRQLCAVATAAQLKITPSLSFFSPGWEN